MEREFTYTVKVRDEGVDGLWAEVAELPGCFASGDTIEELQVALLEAIGLYLSDGARSVTVSQPRAQPSLSAESRQQYIVD